MSGESTTTSKCVLRIQDLQTRAVTEVTEAMDRSLSFLVVSEADFRGFGKAVVRSSDRGIPAKIGDLSYLYRKTSRRISLESVKHSLQRW